MYPLESWFKLCYDVVAILKIVSILTTRSHENSCHTLHEFPYLQFVISLEKGTDVKLLIVRTRYLTDLTRKRTESKFYQDIIIQESTYGISMTVGWSKTFLDQEL